MLVVFTANVSAVCNCNPNMNSSSNPEHQTNCCKKNKVIHCANSKKDSKEKSCPCEKRIITFNQLEKQVSQNLAITPVTVDFENLFFDNCSSKEKYFTYHFSYLLKNKWWLYQPPDYCILHQTFRI